MAARPWDGRVEPARGEVRVEVDRLRVHEPVDAAFSAAGAGTAGRAEARFPNDYLPDSRSWVASTREAPLHGPTTEWHVRSGKSTPVLQQPSVFLHLDAAAAGGPLNLRTAGGDFDLDPRTLRPFRAEHFLDGGVRVERVPVVVRVGPAQRGQQDFPALVATRAGALWIAWQEFDDAGDTVYARRRVEGSWGEPEALARNTDVFRTALAEDARGRVWAIWAEQLHGDWELVGRCHDGARWSPPERLTRAPGLATARRSTLSLWTGGKDHAAGLENR